MKIQQVIVNDVLAEVRKADSHVELGGVMQSILHTSLEASKIISSSTSMAIAFLFLNEYIEACTAEANNGFDSVKEYLVNSLTNLANELGL